MTQISSAEQGELLTKQAGLVSRLAAVASSQQRILSYMNADFQDFDAAPSMERSGYDTDNEAEIQAVDEAVMEASAITRTAADLTVEDSKPDNLWDEDAAKSLKEYEKDWVSQLVPPSDYKADDSKIRDQAPPSHLVLDHVYGYRSKGCRDNIALADEDTLVYHAAGVGIVESISSSRQRHFRGHDDEILCLDYNATRRIVATGQLGQRARVCVWRVDDPSAAPLLEIPFAFGVAGISISDDGSHLVGVGLDADHSVLVVNLNTGKELVRQPTGPNRIIDVAWGAATASDANPMSFITVGVKHITFWRVEGDSEDPKLIHTAAALGRLGELQTFPSVATTPAATYIGTESGSLYVFMENRLVRAIDAHSGAIFSINVRASKKEIITGGRDGFVNIWESETLRQVSTLDLNAADKCQGINSVKAIAVNPSDDGPSPSIVVGTVAGSIYKFSGPAHKRSAVITNHFGDLLAKGETAGRGALIAGLAMHPSQLVAATGGDDNSLRLWDLKKHKQTQRADFRHHVTCCAYNTDGTRIVVGFDNGSVCLLNSRNLFTLHSTIKSAKAVTCVSFSPDSSFVAVGYADERLRLFKVDGSDADALQLEACHAFEGTVTHIDWSVDAALLRLNTVGLNVHYINPKDASPVDAIACRDVVYHTHTCPLSWETQGVWPLTPNGTEVTSVAATKPIAGSSTPTLVASSEDSGNVKLFNYPCVGSGFSRKTKSLSRRPHSDSHLCHGRHAKSVQFAFDNTILMSVGGTDGCVLQWTVKSM